jgi:NAD(P)-binding Rossmann-like domain
MRELETDYLVVGAGATGMAFVDTLIAESDADVVMVDRRHRPGGHWLDAYPFVRLHQPSANYGVNSRILGNDRVDEFGPNAGFYERATAPEICDYFNRVLDETLLPSGQVRIFGMSDYRGVDGDGHHFTSLLSGEDTIVKVRRKVVDATYIESEIPATSQPKFEVDAGVRVLSPNDLVHLGDAPAGYTIIGAGKTAMDTCNWLLDVGVAPDDIRWIKSRDGWFFDREYFQPLELVGSYMTLQARWIEAVAAAASPTDFLHRMEATGIFVRVDDTVEPEVWRGATLSRGELDALREIENVVRLGKVRRVGSDGVKLELGDLSTPPGEIYVNCTAAGIRPVPTQPVFHDGSITMQFVTIGIAGWSASTIAVIEALREDDAEKNALCPIVAFTGEASNVLEVAYKGMSGLVARSMQPDIAAWTESCRLNPARGAAEHMDDPRVPEAFAAIATHFGPAMENLERRVS